MLLVNVSVQYSVHALYVTPYYPRPLEQCTICDLVVAGSSASSIIHGVVRMEYTKDQPVQREKASRYGENRRKKYKDRRDKGGMEYSQKLHLRVATPFVALPVWQRRSGEGTRHRQPPTAATAPYRRIGEQLRLATGRRSRSLVLWFLGTS